MFYTSDYSIDQTVYQLARRMAEMSTEPAVGNQFLGGPMQPNRFMTSSHTGSSSRMSFLSSQPRWSKVVGDGREIDIEDQRNWRELFQKPKRKPADDYICHNCYVRGDHHVKQCPKVLPPDVKCTPYQGAKPCIGEFYCSTCKRYWLSHFSFSNTSEKCKKCKREYFPKKQYTKASALKCGLYDKPRYRKYATKWQNDSTSDSGRGSDSPCSSDGGQWGSGGNTYSQYRKPWKQ